MGSFVSHGSDEHVKARDTVLHMAKRIIEEQVGTHFIVVEPGKGSCRFTVVDDATGWKVTGAEPGPCSNARAAARRLVIRRQSKQLGGRRRRRR